MDLKECHPDIDINHWYYHSKFLATKKMLNDGSFWPSPLIKECVLADIGAGSALFTKAFLQSLNAPSKKAYAVDINYPDEQLGLHEGINFVRELQTDIMPTHLFFMDVLEHIEDDRGFLKGWVKRCLPGTTFIITVPSFNFLWSEHDVFLGHKRRYTLKKIKKVIKNSGLEVLKSRYFFAAIFPIVFAVRKILEPLYRLFGKHRKQGIAPAQPWLNSLLKSILKLEVKIGSFNCLFGITCIVIARKPIGQ